MGKSKFAFEKRKATDKLINTLFCWFMVYVYI